MRSPIVRATAIFAAVVITSWLAAWLLAAHLPVNRTSEVATLQILVAAVLTIGGPIVGLFLAICHYRREMRGAAEPSVVILPVDRAAVRRSRITRFVVIGLPVGLMLMIFFGSMVIPAAWLAGGGDMPVGHGNPNDMRVGRTILYVSISMTATGAILLVTSLVTGIGLLLTRKKLRETGLPND